MPQLRFSMLAGPHPRSPRSRVRARSGRGRRAAADFGAFGAISVCRLRRVAHTVRVRSPFLAESHHQKATQSCYRL